MSYGKNYAIKLAEVWVEDYIARSLFSFTDQHVNCRCIPDTEGVIKQMSNRIARKLVAKLIDNYLHKDFAEEAERISLTEEQIKLVKEEIEHLKQIMEE